MLLVFSIAMLIQDTSDEAVGGAGCGSWGTGTTASTSFRFDEVVWISVATMRVLPVDGGLFFSGKVKPGEAGSKE